VPRDVTITVDGRSLTAPEGATLASVLMDAGITHFRTSVTGEPRAPVCGMGVCFECRVTVGGRPHQRSCLIPCVDGLRVETRPNAIVAPPAEPAADRPVRDCDVAVIGGGPAGIAAATAAGSIETRLQEQLIAANARLTTLETYMRDDAPTLRVLRATIRSLEQQRQLLARRVTGREDDGPVTLSGALAGYEQLESRRKFAEAAYQLALRGVDEARASADRQHVFVASFVPPAMPQEASYPRRWRSLGVVALMAFATWAIGGLAAQSVRDHLW